MIYSRVGCVEPSSDLLGDSQRWYAVQTKSGREALALLHLRRQDIHAFCPMRRKPRRVAKRLVSPVSPLFPGYIFASIDLAREQWRSVNGTIGVVRIVGFGPGGPPAPLPVGFIERLRESSEEDGAVRLRSEFVTGDRVRLVGGPFDDLCGTLERARDSERVTILLDLLSKETRVNVRRDLLIAA